jgi:hypothetical protein
VGWQLLTLNPKMKTVFKSDEIAHIWAHSGAPHGRSPGNLSFDGDAIKSYSTVIGRRIRAAGKVAYVLDRASFSNSTSKSQGRVWQAIPGDAQSFHVHCGRRGQFLDFTPVTLRDHFLHEAKEREAATPSRYARIRVQQYANITASYRTAREVCIFFKLGTAALDKKLAARLAGESQAAETLKAALIRRQAAKAKRDVKELKERTARNIQQAEDFLANRKRPAKVVELLEKALATLPDDLRGRLLAAVEKHNAPYLAEIARKEAEKIAEWRAGKNVYLSGEVPTMLRAEGDSEAAEMVTSRGARVPLADAERTYRFACLMRARGWHKNGETHAIGSYQLDSVNEQGVIAGCHRVTWAEIEHFAKAQGWAA